MKRGLVLEGGGAKGAYELGCLLAFRNKSVTFDVIAGTSVGALNAMLAGTGRLVTGKSLWQGLSFDKVCTPSKQISSWVLMPFYILAMFLHHVSIVGSPPFSSRQTPKSGYAYIALVTGIPLGFVWLVVAISMWFVDNILSFLIPVLVMTGITVILGVLWAIPYWVRQKNISLFTMDPLRLEIQSVLKGARFTIPIYATLAERQEMFDPDRPGFYHISGDIGYKRRAISREEYVPRYVRLDILDASEQTDILIASAAIPFGVFPAVVLDGVEYIDGGVADNIPLVPIMAFHQCDEVYVIRSRPHRRGELEKHWQKIDRRLRVANMEIATCKAMYRKAMNIKRAGGMIDDPIDPPENVPVREFPMNPTQLVVISPQKLLGSFLSGTMNFRGRYATKLIELGFNDACAVMDSIKLGTYYYVE